MSTGPVQQPSHGALQTVITEMEYHLQYGSIALGDPKVRRWLSLLKAQQEQTLSSAGMVLVPAREVQHVASFLELFRGKQPSQVSDFTLKARLRVAELADLFKDLSPKESTTQETPKEG